jgi:hypothetical protein
MLEQQAAVRNLVGHPPRVDAALQVPAVDVVDRSGTEGQVNKLAHFPELTWVANPITPGPEAQ